MEVEINKWYLINQLVPVLDIRGQLVNYEGSHLDTLDDYWEKITIKMYPTNK